MPKVSIILPVHNAEATLPAAISSVLRQDFLDWELLIIDDGSTDGSKSLIEDRLPQEPRIKLITNNQNLGLVATLNKGLGAAMGEYVARIDADDEWVLKNKLKGQVEFLENNPKVGLVGTWAQVVAPDNRPLYQFKPPAKDHFIRKQILSHNCFVHSSILASRNLIMQAGGYSSQELHVEDYGLWLRMGKLSQLANLPQIMVSYRANPAGVTQQNNRAQVAAALKLISEHRKDYPNYLFAVLKWRLQKILAPIFGLKNMLMFKQIIH